MTTKTTTKAAPYSEQLAEQEAAAREAYAKAQQAEQEAKRLRDEQRAAIDKALTGWATTEYARMREESARVQAVRRQAIQTARDDPDRALTAWLDYRAVAAEVAAWWGAVGTEHHRLTGQLPPTGPRLRRESFAEFLDLVQRDVEDEAQRAGQARAWRGRETAWESADAGVPVEPPRPVAQFRCERYPSLIAALTFPDGGRTSVRFVDGVADVFDVATAEALRAANGGELVAEIEGGIDSAEIREVEGNKDE